MKKPTTVNVEFGEEKRERYFKLKGYRVTDEWISAPNGNAPGSFLPQLEAIVMLENGDGALEHTVAAGNGPVNALDNALRKALRAQYPEIDDIVLDHYRVGEVNSQHGTAAEVQVTLLSSDKKKGGMSWKTTAVSRNIITASLFALIDSIVFKLNNVRLDGHRE